MKKFGFMRKKGISFLLALSFLLLLTTSFMGCSNSDDNSDVSSFSAETRADFTTAVDAALAAATNKRGISVAVYKDGYKMWTYAAGYADGDYAAATGTAMTPDTPTFAYSITKTFISALILKHIEEGRYSLTDTVESLLGSNADYMALSAPKKALLNTNATVEQLLTHTSGMLDYAANLPGEIAMCDPAYTTWKPVDILENLVYQPLGVPGTFHYSNTNYVLLGMIAQEHSVGKLPLNTLLKNTFFNRLGIDAILAPQDVFPPADIAHPYDDAVVFGFPGVPLGSFMDFSVAIKNVDPTYDLYLGIGKGTWAAGGIIATAANLAKWGHALYDDKGAAVTPTVRTTLKNSATTDGAYGYGINYNDFTYTDSTIGGEYSHGGSAPGYRTLLVYEKAKGITVAIITNVNNSATGTGLIDQWALAEGIFNAYKK
jgi:D-alanyl-D-alanine carboxypeptidase